MKSFHQYITELSKDTSSSPTKTTSNAISKMISNAASFYSKIPSGMLGPMGRTISPMTKGMSNSPELSILQQLRNHKAEKQTPKTPKTPKTGAKPVIKKSPKGQSSGGVNPPQA